MMARNLLQMADPVSIMDGTMAQDFKAIGLATQHIGEHVVELLELSLPGTILQYVAIAAAVYLFVMDRTNWRTNLLTALLVPYIALNLPTFLLELVRGEIGHWIAFIAVVVKLFFASRIPPHSELPASLIILLVVAPEFLVGIRFEFAGIIISIAIGGYLLYEHIIHAGGFKKAFADIGAVITIGILCLFIAPVWQFLGKFSLF